MLKRNKKDLPIVIKVNKVMKSFVMKIAKRDFDGVASAYIRSLIEKDMKKRER